MTLKVILEKGDDGYVVASCPSLKGCHSQGKTETEAIANIKEAILLYLEPNPNDLKSAHDHKILELAL